MNTTHILIVEDEGIVAKDLQAMLRRMGYHVPTTVGTGDLAIQNVAQNCPDLILMDIQLRGPMDGVQAAQTINARHDVPIVYLTANSDESTLQRAKATAPFGFLVKPFEERAIQAGIEMALYKHRTDRRIREREQWLATTLTSIADAVITTDEGGQITFLNAAAEGLSGWTVAEALHRPYREIFRIMDERTRHEPFDRVATALSEGATSKSSDPTLLIRRDGSELPIEHSAAPIRQGMDAQISGCVIVFSDVSERKELEARFRQVQKMDALGKLAGGIAHDFNNAITAIIGYAELMLMQLDHTSSLGSDAREIIRAAEHSARLTHQLLAFTRNQVLQPRSLKLAEELAHVEGMIRRLIGENIALNVTADADLWEVAADAGQMHQVVLNMAINARDAMPQGGQLRLALSNATVSDTEALRIPDGVAGDYVLLSIADTGTGMSAETVQRIFEPFFTTKEVGKGTGLGLATCHGIIKQTSGMITVKSALGVGTTFSIYLPRTREGVPVAVEQGSARNAALEGNETILLVEDDEFVRKLAHGVLQKRGYSVIAVENGTAAVKILSTELRRHIDLVATDLMMPGMNGQDLGIWIRSNLCEMPILYMSGYTDDPFIRQAAEDAEIHYLQKPFTAELLVQKIRQILDLASPLTTAA